MTGGKVISDEQFMLLYLVYYVLEIIYFWTNIFLVKRLLLIPTGCSWHSKKKDFVYIVLSAMLSIVCDRILIVWI